MKIDHIAIAVNDVEQAAKQYQGALGVEKIIYETVESEGVVTPVAEEDKMKEAAPAAAIPETAAVKPTAPLRPPLASAGAAPGAPAASPTPVRPAVMPARPIPQAPKGA